MQSNAISQRSTWLPSGFTFKDFYETKLRSYDDVFGGIKSLKRLNSVPDVLVYFTSKVDKVFPIVTLKLKLNLFYTETVKKGISDVITAKIIERNRKRNDKNARLKANRAKKKCSRLRQERIFTTLLLIARDGDRASPPAYADFRKYRKYVKTTNRYADVKLQSGIDAAERKLEREMVEVHYRALARKVASQQKKKTIPKEERAAYKKLRMNDKRKNQVEMETDFQFQSSYGEAADIALKISLAASALTVAGYGVYTMRKLSQTSNRADDIFFSLKKMVAQIKENMGDCLFWYVPLLLLCYKLAIHHGVLISAVCVVLAFVFRDSIKANLIKPLLDIFQKVAGEIEPQSSTFGTASKLIATLFCFSTFAGKVDQRAVTEFTRRIGTLDRSSTGWEAFMTWCISGIQSIVNYIRSLFGLERVKLLSDAHEPMHEWMSKVDSLFAKVNSGAYIVNPDDLPQFMELVQLGSAYKDLYRLSTYARDVDATFVRATNLLIPFLGAVDASKNNRVEPVFAMFLGDSGIGKTTLAVTLCSTILAESGILGPDKTSSDYMREIFAKGTSPYWNSYARQACMVLDDAFQVRPVAGDPENEIIMIIRAISGWAFPLNFADLASKGKIFFGSKLLFGTTNVASIRNDASLIIHEPEAVVRRISHPYKLSLTERFKRPDNGRLNWALFAPERDACAARRGTVPSIDCYPWHVWKLQKHDFLTGVTDSTFLDVRTEILNIARELAMRCSAHLRDAASLSAVLDSYVPSTPADDANYMRLQVPLPRTEPVPIPMVQLHEEQLMTYLSNLRRTGGIGPFGPVSPAGSVDSDNLLERDLDELPLEVVLPDVQLQCKLEDAFDALYDRSDMPPWEWNMRKRSFVRQMAAEREDKTFLGRIKSLFSSGYAACERATVEVIDNTRAFTTESWFVTCAQRIISCPVTKWILSAAGVVVIIGCLKLIHTGVSYAITAIKTATASRKVQEQSNVPIKGVRAALQNGATERLQEITFGNSAAILIEVEGKHTPLGSVLFLCDSLIVLPEHFIVQLEKLYADGKITGLSCITLQYATRTPVKFSCAAFLKCPWIRKPTVDVAFMDLKSLGLSAHKNITKFFMSEHRIKTLGGKRARLDVLVPDTQKQRIYPLELSLQQNLTTTVRKFDRVLAYNAHSVAGDCGGTVTVCDPVYGSHIIVGLHIAGCPGFARGFANIVTMEMIKDAMTSMKIVRDEFFDDAASRGVQIVPQSGPVFATAGSFESIGKIADPIVTAPYSRMFKIPGIYGRYGDYDYLPAPLAPVQRTINGVHTFVDPMEEAMRNFGSPVLIYEQKYLDLVVHVAMRRLTQSTQTFTRAIYTFDESVRGIPEARFRAIPRDTSPGFPYRSACDLPGKHDFFGSDPDYDLDTPKCAELRARVSHVLSEARSGVRLCHIFTDFLKDELRSPEKVEAVATRAISSAPLDYVVAWRMMFGAFSTACMSRYIISGMAPGINSYTEWNALANHLQERGLKVFDGDFKAFDSSEMPTLHNKLLDYINRWYDDGPENARIREVLWRDLTHSRHVGGLDRRTIYQWNKSLPSGHPFTTICNSMYSLTALVIAYQKCVGNCVSFWDNVSPQVYGDDNVANVADGVADRYNQETVALALSSELGLTYTPGRKDGKWCATTSIDQLTFLKRGFRHDENLGWTAPLEPTSFLFTNYWCSNRMDMLEIIKANCEGSLRELSLHDQEMWDAHCNDFRDILLEHCGGTITRAPLDRLSYQDQAVSLEDNWY